MNKVEKTMALFEELFEEIEKAPKKTIEERLAEGERIQQVISSEPELYDGWSKAFEDERMYGKLSKKCVIVLEKIERYPSMSMRGLKEVTKKYMKVKELAAQLYTLGERRLVRVNEPDGRSVWEITEKGKGVLRDLRGDTEGQV